MSERSGSSSIPTVRVTEPNPVPTRLGVFPSGDGLDVAVVARAASGVDMCIFDEAGAARYRHAVFARYPQAPFASQQYPQPTPGD